MRKVLVAAVITCLILGLAVGAMAVELSWSGSAEFGIKGTTKEGEASGTFFGKGKITLTGTATSGPWEVGVEISADPGVGDVDGYLKYSAEAFTLTLEDSVDNSIYDVGGAAGSPNIPGHAGLKLEVPFGSSFYIILNNTGVGEDVVYNFAGGADFAVGALDLGVTFNSNGEEAADWYGSSYALKVGYSLDAVSLTAQYGAWSPVAAGLEAGSGYYFKMGYSLAGGGAFTLSYTGVDKNLNGKGTPTPEDYSKIYAEYTTPIAENVDLTFDVTSTDDGSGAETVTTWEGKIAISF